MWWNGSDPSTRGYKFRQAFEAANILSLRRSPPSPSASHRELLLSVSGGHHAHENSCRLAVLICCAEWASLRLLFDIVLVGFHVSQANAARLVTEVDNAVLREQATGKKYTTTETEPVLNTPARNTETVANKRTGTSGPQTCTAAQAFV